MKYLLFLILLASCGTFIPGVPGGCRSQDINSQYYCMPEPRGMR